MSAVVRLNKQGLNDLINNMKAGGNDTTELDNLMASVNDDERNHRPVRRVGNPVRIMVEEPTTEERLEAEVGELFPKGITKNILAECIEMDREHTLPELKEMCIGAGLSTSGSKKELAAKLIAKGVE